MEGPFPNPLPVVVTNGPADLSGRGSRPSTCYFAKSRPTSACKQRDEELKAEIAGVHEHSFGATTPRRVWRQLNREGIRVELALDALEMALWARGYQEPDGLVHHSHRGVQYLAVRYTKRLAEAGAVPSVGSHCDSYDNALPQTVCGRFRTEPRRTRNRQRLKRTLFEHGT